MLDTLKFLSTGFQFGLLIIFVVLVMLFMKVAALEDRIEQMEDVMSDCASKDEFIEALHLMRQELPETKGG